MSRKIRNLAGEPVGAKEADREIRGCERERMKSYDAMTKPKKLDDEELVRRYCANRLVFDPSRTLLSTELVDDFVQWAEDNRYKINRAMLVPMFYRSELFSAMHGHNVQRVQVALVTDKLLAKLDTDTPPVTKSVAVWHGVRWRTEEEDLL